jgi:hypothetical protein
MKNETQSKIQFGTGEDAVIHIVDTSQVDSYLKHLSILGWNMHEITSISVI